MHRAGTSAVTRLVNLLGVPAGADEALKRPSVHNPTGFWEVAELTKLNEELLVELGGSWAAPPHLSGRWQDDERLARRRADARALFDRSHPTAQWVWKDPRNSILLPFWRDALGAEPIVVLVCRDPREIVESLAARDRFSHRHALALWERHLRLTLTAIDGLPVLVARYAEILSSPDAWMESAREFLRDRGLDCPGDAGDETKKFLDPALRHTEFGAADVAVDPSFSDSQRELFAILEGLAPSYDRFDLPPLPEETPSTEPLLAEHRFVERALAADRRRLADARRARRRAISRLRRRIEQIDEDVGQVIAGAGSAGGQDPAPPIKRLRRDIGRARALLDELATSEEDQKGSPDG